MIRTNLITHERLREVLDYDPRTGSWTWRIRKSQAKKHGDVAGTVDKSRNRLNVWVDGIRYRGARLAWFWMTGIWPIEVDHIDFDNSNDRWYNLREATRHQNGCHRRLFKNNTSGAKGVHFHKRDKKWYVSLKCNRQTMHIGVFPLDQKDAAIYAYDEAVIRFHKKFAVPNSDL